ncbi:MAG: recombinase family protein [Lachnospiraceae bacterium]|nr:recombinase family protein [Lachnospiraceae bacterium]
MKRIGIYHYQYYRGACKLCYRHFIQEMVESYEKCHEVAKEIYGEDCEFLHYTDFGQYDSNDTDRPSFRRMKEAMEKGELDVLMCYTLNNITTNEEQLIALYKEVRARGMDFLTAGKGLDAMKFIDKYIEQNHL